MHRYTFKQMAAHGEEDSGVQEPLEGEGGSNFWVYDV